MFSFGKKSELPFFEVTVFLSGKHPYRTEPEFQYKSREVTVTVRAKNWNKAANIALNMVTKAEVHAGNWYSGFVSTIVSKGYTI